MHGTEPAHLSPFAQAVSLEADNTVAGRFHGIIDHRWQLAVTPQGGVVAAIAAQAMTNALRSPEQVMRSMSVVFAGQVHVGEVQVDVQVLRRGRLISQLMATVINPGEPAGLSALAVFGASRPGFSFTDVPYPTGVGEPSAYQSSRGPWPEEAVVAPWHENPFAKELVENRFVTGHAPWEDYLPTGSEVVMFSAFDNPMVDTDGWMSPYGLLVHADAMPSAVGERMGNDTVEWFGPSADLTFHWFAPTKSRWVLIRFSARHAGDGYASVDAHLWDPTTKQLIGYATQQAFFTFANGAPTGDATLPIDLRC